MHALPLPWRALPAVLALALLAGCATASAPLQKGEGRVPLTAGTLALLEGTYAHGQSNAPCGGPCVERLLPALAHFGRRTARGPVPVDSADVFTLRVRDPHHLVVTASRDGVLAEERLLRGDVTEGGSFEVAEARWIAGTPPLVWGPEHRRARLSVDDRGTLRVERTRAGVAMVLVMPFVSFDLSDTYTFARVS